MVWRLTWCKNSFQFTQIERTKSCVRADYVIDDLLAGKYGSFSFDGEGNYSQQTVLIEKGVLKDYLMINRKNRASTGNGRRDLTSIGRFPG